MLPEEALIVLLAFGALGLLALGLWNFLWPTRSTHPVARRRPAEPRTARPHRQSALQRHGRDRNPKPAYSRRQTPLTPSPIPLAPLPASLRGARAAADVVAPEPAERIAETAPVEHSLPEPVALEAAAASPVSEIETAPAELEAVPLETTPADLETAPAAMEATPIEMEPTPVAMEPAPVRLETAPVVGVPAEGDSVVETCFALYQEQRYAEVIDRATEVLTGGPAGRPRSDPQETAALWSIVALARQALGEDTGARSALERAIAEAPDSERSIYERQLASLAETVAKGLLAEAQRHGKPDSDDSLGLVRSAVSWLERGATAMPKDHRLDDLLASARAVLWPAWERTVVALAQRQDFRGARRLLREAMAEPSFPAGRTETFKELFSGTFSGEIGQLTAQAIRSMQEARESDALASLQRAETLLDTLNSEALPPGRREEVDRRLWWGYNKLGARRVEAGEHESALEALFHALGYEVGPARRQETMALLVRALDGVADARALAIRELADTGDREAALVQYDKLWALLRSATEMGLTQPDLGATFAKAQRLLDNVGRRG